MITIAFIGLVLDLIGVLILGVDLWLLQFRLKRDAKSRLDCIQEILDNHDNTEEWLKDLSKQADWREGTLEEGRIVRYGNRFDHSAAQTDFSELSGTVGQLATDFKILAELVRASVSSDRETAGRSLWLTMLGLFLISLGFILQALAALGVSYNLTDLIAN